MSREIEKKNFLYGYGRIAAVGVALALLLIFPLQSFAAEYIGESAARSIALKHAGYSESAVTVVKSNRYDKHRRELYHIIFLTDDAKYSYEIDAVSGEVMAYYRNSRRGKRPGNDVRTDERQAGRNYIGTEKAKSIAFAHAKVSESGVYKLEVQLKDKKYRPKYEIEFKHGGMEYEYEIDALTGDILDWEAERD